MRKYMAVLLGCLFVIISMTSAFADISSPTVYCAGKEVSARDIVEYDIAKGSLTITWDKQTGASTYSYKCIGLNEVPDFEDTNQATSENTIKHGENTSDRTFTVSKSKLKKYDYLKIAVGVFDSSGNERWCNFGVKLTNSDLIVKAPSAFYANTAVDDMEIVDYDLADGALTIKWTPQSAAKKYEYSCVGLNEAPDFYDEDQGKEIKSGKVTSNTASKCKFDLTKSKMQGYSYLKVTITAYDSDGEAYKTCFGVRLTQESDDELSLSKTSLSLSYKENSASVTVSGVSSYTVSYPTEDETVEGKKWLTVTKSGSNIKVEARANYGTSARSETITVTSADGQTASIVVTQKAGYSAPTASIKIGSTTYSSGDTYGPLANGGEDTLYLTVSVKNAQRIYVGTNNTTIGHKEVTLKYSSTASDQECFIDIPAGLTPGVYPFTIYVSNSDVKEDQWAQSITPITLNVRVVGTDTSSHQYALLGGHIEYIPGQDYFTDDGTKKCTDHSKENSICNSRNFEGATQCAGFAKYVEKTIYGKLGDYLDGKQTGLLSKSAVSVDTLKELITRAGVGANMRAGIDESQYDKGHSMIITAIDDDGFDVIHANWDYYCGVSTKRFTWQSYLTWLQKNHTYRIGDTKYTSTYGIRYIRVHNPGQTSVPTETPDETPTTGWKTSDKGIQFIKDYEGLKLYKYNDMAGHATIGYGHKIQSGESFPDTITKEEAEELLQKDLVKYEKIVNNFISANGVTLNQNQFDALVSMVFNLGADPLTTTCRIRTLLLEYKVGSDIPAWQVYNAIARWHHAGGVDVAGLYYRRMNEAKMFTSGVYSTAKWEIPSWLTDKKAGPDVPDDWYSDYCVNPSTTPDDTSHQYALLGGYIDYIPGQDYFTESKTKECTGNNSVSGGTCKSIEYDYAYQCAGFAKYVEMTIYGKYGDYLDGKESDLLTHANVTVDSLKQLIQRAGLGANVRAGATSDSGATTGVGHSMIVTAISDTGFDVIHCNWDNCCGISTKTWTWESFKTWLDKKGYGIEKIRVHNPVEDSDPTKANAPTFVDYTAFTVTDYDLSEGGIIIMWKSDNADRYYVKAILLNEEPVVGDSSQADRAVKVVLDGPSAENLVLLWADELTGAQYLKFAVGAAVDGQEDYTWSWVGFKLNGTFASSEADMLLPASLTAIEDEAFYGLPMSSVYCPDGLKSIGAKAFANCTSLRKVRIPASVTQIDASAFNGCTNLLIFGTKGSTAETFAKEHNFTFIAE